ncbi:MAG TPA: hypothetical protein VNL39_05830 [Xanthobacteraceae bacterium]|nr:hypothetical protein [Xanthobacteraceae bacterium]
MRVIAIAAVAVGLMVPGTATASSVDETSVLAQATAVDQATTKKKKAKRKRAPKIEYMRAVPSR